MSWYREQLESFLKTLDIKADTVLDIGGAQGPVKGRTKSWDVRKYAVLDLPEYDLEIDDLYEAKDSLNFSTYEGKVPSSEIGARRCADIVFCLEVFEYLIDPILALQKIEDLLKLEGKAFITFCFSYPHHNELEMDSLRYTEPGIKRLAEAAGLRVTNTWYRRDKSGLLQSFYAADGMRAAKEYPNHNATGFIMELSK